MDNPHKKIYGYRDLSADDIAVVNQLKALEADVGDMLEKLDRRIFDVDREACRWISLARSNLETGFMYAIKAVARPTNGLGRKNLD